MLKIFFYKLLFIYIGICYGCHLQRSKPTSENCSLLLFPEFENTLVSYSKHLANDLCFGRSARTYISGSSKQQWKSLIVKISECDKFIKSLILSHQCSIRLVIIRIVLKKLKLSRTTLCKSKTFSQTAETKYRISNELSFITKFIT